MNTLNLIYVKYFCDAVRFESIAAAAKANFVTQSAVSQGIAKLESSLGVSLLSHHPNRFRVTPEGENLFADLADLLTRSGEIQNRVSGGKIDYMGDLVFASTLSFANVVLPRYLKKFTSEFSHVRIDFALCFPLGVKESIKNGRIDFGILPDEGDLDNFKKQNIYSGSFRFYSAPGMQIKEKHWKFITTEPTSKETIFLKKAYYKRFKKELIDLFVVDSWEMIAVLASQGLGICYLPDYFVEARENLSLQEYPLGIETEEYQIVAISAKGMKLRKSSEIFLSYFVLN
jgi:LysR family transcriptional regulator, carnitine catabolism transcriptional activator